MTITAIPEERPDLMPRIVGVLFVSTTSGELSKVTLGLPAATGPILRDRLPFILASRSRMLSLSRRERFPVVERQIAKRFLFGRPARPRDVGHVVDQLIHAWPETMSGFFKDMMEHDRIGNLAAFDDIPATVLVGSRDLLTPPSTPASSPRASAAPGCSSPRTPGTISRSSGASWSPRSSACSSTAPCPASPRNRPASGGRRGR